MRGWTGKNKAFCFPGTRNGRRVIKVYAHYVQRPQLRNRARDNSRDRPRAFVCFPTRNIGFTKIASEASHSVISRGFKLCLEKPCVLSLTYPGCQRFSRSPAARSVRAPNEKKTSGTQGIIDSNTSRFWTPGVRFSKLPVITGPVKLFCFKRFENCTVNCRELRETGPWAGSFKARLS